MNRNDSFNQLIDLFNLSHTGLWQMSKDNRVSFYNTKFYEQFDISLTHSTLEEWMNLVHPDDRMVFEQNVKTHRESDHDAFLSEYRVLDKEGHYIWIEAQGMIHSLEEGTMIGSHTDITTRKSYEAKLYEDAYLDALTHLPNAKKLIIDVEADLSNQEEGSLLFLDLSFLNHMLTVYGQDFIDRLILSMTGIIQSVYSDVFEVYRFIPFVFSFRTKLEVEEAELKRRSKTLEESLSTLYLSFNLSSEVVYKMVMMAYPQEEYFPSCEDMFNRIFLTLEEMTGHEDKLIIYTNQTRQRIHRKMFIETHLIKALEDNEFYAVFQPILKTGQEQVYSFEALCRWTNSDLGPIYPDEFISLAEKSGAIIRIGSFILDAACSFIQSYNQRHNSALSVSVNASVVELMNPGYFDLIQSTLKAYKLHPSSLILEITESLMLDDNPLILAKLLNLKEEGVGIAIDDFGTGYSSINTMFSIPLTELKIDREVMLKLNTHKMTYDYIKSLVALCHDHGIHLVAEGIEDLEMIALSKDLDLDYLQGYFFAKPLTLEEALEFKNHKKPT